MSPARLPRAERALLASGPSPSALFCGSRQTTALVLITLCVFRFPDSPISRIHKNRGSRRERPACRRMPMQCGQTEAERAASMDPTW